VFSCFLDVTALSDHGPYAVAALWVHPSSLLECPSFRGFSHVESLALQGSKRVRGSYTLYSFLGLCHGLCPFLIGLRLCSIHFLQVRLNFGFPWILASVFSRQASIVPRLCFISSRLASIRAFNSLWWEYIWGVRHRLWAFILAINPCSLFSSPF
jgi:hypothetical protein